MVNFVQALHYSCIDGYRISALQWRIFCSWTRKENVLLSNIIRMTGQQMLQRRLLRNLYSPRHKRQMPGQKVTVWKKKDNFIVILKSEVASCIFMPEFYPMTSCKSEPLHSIIVSLNSILPDFAQNLLENFEQVEERERAPEPSESAN